MADEQQEPTDEPGGGADGGTARAFGLEVGWVALLTSVGPLAFLVTAITGSRWSGAVVLLAGLSVIAWRVTKDSPGRVRLAGDIVTLGSALWVMTVLHGLPGWQYAVAGTLIATVATLAEQPIRRLYGIWIPFVANMPGLAPAPRPLRYATLIGRLDLGAFAAGVIVAAAGLPSWVWLISAVLTTVSPSMVLGRAVQRILAGRRIERGMAGAVSAYAPEFVVYTSRPDDASYQVLMWLPYLQRTERRFIIVARTNVAALAIAANTDVPVVTRRGVSDLDDVVSPSLRAAFYVNASSGNGAFVRYKQLTHVYLGHGDSDKAPSYNPTHAMYDRIFAAGPAAVDRYAAHGVDISRQKFDIVGRPQVEGVEVSSAGTPPRTVLYAPTWRGHVTETMLYSLPIGEQIVDALLRRGMTVIFRPHPFSYDFPDDAAVIERIHAMLTKDTARSGRKHLFGAAAESERGIVECINSSDAMVSDVSSVVSDYLFSRKPLAIVAVPCEPEAFIREYPVARAAYIIDAQLGNVARVFDDMLGTDPMRPERLRIRGRYLGDFPEISYAQVFVDACIRVIDTRRPPHTGSVDDSIDDAAATSRTFVERLRAQFALYGRDFTLATTTLLVFTFVVAGQRLAAGLLALVVLAAGVVLSRRSVGGLAPLNRLLGSLTVTRTLLGLALLVAWLEVTLNVAVAVPILVMTALTFTELSLRAAWATPGTGAVNVPGLEDPSAPRIPRGVLPATAIVVLVLGWALWLLRWPATALGLAIVILVAVWALVLRSTLVRLAELDAVRDHLPQRIAEYGPQFAVYFGSTIGADYQVGMWLPYLRRIGTRFIVVTRTMPMLRAIAALDDVPVVYRPTLRSLEDVIVPSLTAAFYVNNAVRNTHFIERRELTHIWLNHGDSEKPACYNPVHAIYDKLFVAGQAGIDRYARHGVVIPRSKFEIVGRPQVERIDPARGPIATLTERTVLYAPTWKGPYADSRVYSLPIGTQIVSELLRRKVRVIFRAHPFNERYPEARTAMKAIGQLLQEDRRRTGREHLWGSVAQDEMSVEECFNASDAMVADVSAVLSDYLKANKPFSIVAIGRTPEHLLADAPVARAAYVLREDMSNIDQICHDLLDADPLAEERRQTRIYYLGAFPDERYADGFLQSARAAIRGGAEVYADGSA